jgi:hypothetical protein
MAAQEVKQDAQLPVALAFEFATDDEATDTVTASALTVQCSDADRDWVVALLLNPRAVFPMQDMEGQSVERRMILARVMVAISARSPAVVHAQADFQEILDEQGDWGFNWMKTLAKVITASGNLRSAVGSVMMTIIAGTRCGEANSSQFTKSQMESFTKKYPAVPRTMFSKDSRNSHNFSGAGLVAAVSPVAAVTITKSAIQIESVLGLQFGEHPLAFHFWAGGVRKAAENDEAAKMYCVWMVGNTAMTAVINKNLREQHSLGRMLDRSVLFPREDISSAMARSQVAPPHEAHIAYDWFKAEFQGLWEKLPVVPTHLMPFLRASGVDIGDKRVVLAAHLSVAAEIGDLRTNDMFGPQLTTVLDSNQEQLSEMSKTMYSQYSATG